MNKEFDYKHIDQEGLETLSVVEKADKFNYWMYKTIKPFCKGNILEIGSGIGNISSFFIRDKSQITLSDIRENYCNQLSEKFPVQPTLCMDLTDQDFDIKFRDHLGSYDTIFALNVVEHIKDDSLAMQNCKKMLKANGNLIILVPAYQSLYNQFDKELYHYRRYTKSSLTDLFKQNDIKVIHSQYFNFAGILGWYVSGKLMKNKIIPEGQMSLYNTLVPVFKIIDKATLNLAGLSVIVVGQKG
jgi:2-polyprenyl-3-methyl-5-hydroxy-6-metoxy-1,4-benzoquinol methylase